MGNDLRFNTNPSTMTECLFFFSFLPLTKSNHLIRGEMFSKINTRESTIRHKTLLTQAENSGYKNKRKLKKLASNKFNETNQPCQEVINLNTCLCTIMENFIETSIMTMQQTVEFCGINGENFKNLAIGRRIWWHKWI